MSQYTKTFLYLPDFITTTDPTSYIRKEVLITTIHGTMISEDPEECESCGGKLHIHQYHTVILKHLAVDEELIQIAVTYIRYKCSGCGKTMRQEIPFKQPHHCMTKLYHRQIMGHLSKGTMPLKHISSLLHTNKQSIKDIDKHRLHVAARSMKPTHQSKFIGVDEFSLHKHHRYATIVIDLETGESLFVEPGNKEEQLHHFFEFVGYGFMKGVKAIAMDMNAQYDAAVRKRYPHIKIVYDPFHIVKNYNDRVISELRKREQRRLREAIEEAKKAGDDQTTKDLKNEYKLYKHSRYVLLSNLATLKAKDAAAKEHNLFLSQNYECRGISLPPGERKQSTTHERRLKDILEMNSNLHSVYVLAELLKISYTNRDPRVFKKDLDKWLALAKQVNIEEVDKFCALIRNHFTGILNHAIYPISNGPLEGTNNLIKTIRRQAYGYRDQEYFFLKIWEATRRYPKNRNFLSHRNTS